MLLVYPTIVSVVALRQPDGLILNAWLAVASASDTAPAVILHVVILLHVVFFLPARIAGG